MTSTRSGLISVENPFEDSYMDFVESLWYGDRRGRFGSSNAELSHAALGLAGECGEAVDIVKKVIRGDAGGLTPEKLEKLEKELGDVIYYWFALCGVAGLNPTEVVRKNMEKLTDRANRGVLKGSGDDR